MLDQLEIFICFFLRVPTVRVARDAGEVIGWGFVFAVVIRDVSDVEAHGLSLLTGCEQNDEMLLVSVLRHTTITAMRLAFSLVLATGAAYALSFAADILIGVVTGSYSRSGTLPIVTWSLVSVVALFTAMVVSRRDKRIAWPYFAFALIAVVGGVVGSSRDFVVAGLLALSGAAIYGPPALWRK
jgi:hypothetical protein